MAKKHKVKAGTRTSRSASSGRTSRPPTRAQLGRLDREIIEKLNERAKLTNTLFQKESAGREMHSLANPALIGAPLKNNKGPLADESLRAIFRELHSGIRQLAATIRVAYLGPLYSYSHLAAVEHFGESVEFVSVSTIAAVFEEVDSSQTALGVVPIENSTDGRVVDTLDMFVRMPVRICAEVQLRIHHHLLGKTERSEIQQVHSKPQALSQCRDWLANHLPAARMVETSSTTVAAELASKEPGTAAIASLPAARHYGLDVIATEIEDNPDNITRFAVIGHTPAARTGRDKTALILELAHQPGALADAMAIFKRNRMNLTWIESFPMRNTNKEYLFFIEFEGHPTEIRSRRALASLERKAVRVEILGSYAQTEPIG